MRINKIEFENFRNFKDHGEIKCSTDGKVTIIYGKNGDGKTTLHQLFQWVFYGQVHFNKTTTDRLYNLQFESECSFGESFQVMGCIDFDHNDTKYSLKRTYIYKKGLDDSEKIAEDVVLNYMNDDHDWRRMDNPKEFIEKLLPSGLSEYFFFDGESMIADLRVKGKDSARKLRRALYSMFDLDVLKSALDHIGKTELKTTVLGKLYLSKGTISSGSKISAIKTNIENAQALIEKHEKSLEVNRKKKGESQAVIQSVSEQIGGYKSKSEYERQRKQLKTQRDAFLKSAMDTQARFGDDVLDMFPKLFISKAVIDAKKRIKIKIEQNKLPEGISKKLISYLLANKTTECVCGRSLCENEKEHIRHYLDMLPPKSFTSLYQEFTKTANSWGKGYDKSKIEGYILDVLNYRELAADCDNQIRELDADEKKSPDIEDLIVARQNAENAIVELDASIVALETELKKCKIYRNKQMKDFDLLTRGNVEGEKALAKIRIMEQVAKYFAKRLEDESIAYSRRLQDNIQSLIDGMLTSKRHVVVSPEFSVRVTDSFDDESKSEGQFAVVSFAYIGGILKMLQSEEHLATKEYPLVLDGPFSKLDFDQRQNVVEMIPKFAPQVILFSKDDLNEIFDSKNIGRVWTIVSNDEKNIARIEEGYLWR